MNLSETYPKYWIGTKTTKALLKCGPQTQSPEVFYEKGVLRNFAKITGKLSFFFNKVAGLRQQRKLY